MKKKKKKHLKFADRPFRKKPRAVGMLVSELFKTT